MGFGLSAPLDLDIPCDIPVGDKIGMTRRSLGIRRMKTIATVIIASVVVLLPTAKATAQTDKESFNFAVMHTPTWVVTATTNVFWPEPAGAREPTVASVECRGEGSQFNFNMNSSRKLVWLSPTFVGKARNKGERDELAYTGDHLWLYLDNEKWEYANIPARSGEFSNVKYPRPESDIITGGWRGYQAVRRSEGEPWLNIDLIYLRIISAKRIEWSFKSRDWTAINPNVVQNRLPENWQKTRYPITNDGLAAAVSWCAKHVASEDAYILPRRMLSGVNDDLLVRTSGNGELTVPPKKHSGD
ncbi:hypothetical protein C8J41_1276 [Sphingomonas sp. PP-CC-3G-468]|nr:hypothetical protein C8J41_1276 [Sphingomonas sp. PP-CC-3G-468]